MRISKVSLYLILSLVVGGMALSGYYYMHSKGDELAQEVVIEKELSLEEAYPFILEKNSSLYVELRKQGVDSLSIQQIVNAAKEKKNLSRLLPGTRFQLFFEEAKTTSFIDPQAEDTVFEDSRLAEVHILLNPVEVLKVARQENDEWSVAIKQEEVSLAEVTYSGVVRSSLWESANEVNMDPELISSLAEIFAWQIDFAREVRAGDRWRIMVTQKTVRGQPVGWGAIKVAEYENSGKSYTAILFEKEGKIKGYFSPDGESMRKMFLKSPLRFARISSRFQRQRFHPILKVNRPHLGVDYAAPTGTPVRSVGSGTVTFVGSLGGGGKTVKIRHNSTYKTAYKHLNGYAKGLRKGSRVEQGQLIGYVGSTGLSTAPHLHFEFFKNGRFVDPLKQVFPSADPIPEQYLSEFRDYTNQILLSLPTWQASN